MLGLALSVASVASCRVEDAHYALRDSAHVTARFERVPTYQDWPSGLALAIDFPATGRTYWWLPWNGGTDNLQNLASTSDVRAPGWHPPSPDGGPRPLGDIDYVATDASYNVIDRVPLRGDPAPAHFLLPRLGDVVWHGDPFARDRAPKQFFDLVTCSGRRAAD